MKLKIIDQENRSKGDKVMPFQFSEEYRPDLIKRAVLAFQSGSRQRYGADPEAGKKHSSKLTKRRKKYRGCYGFGISRVNRKIHSRRGTRMYWVGTFSPQTVGGRRSHPPKAEKVYAQRINQKERKKAIRSAIAATLDKSIVALRGHKIPNNYPFVVDGSFEKMDKTSEVKKALLSLGFAPELERAEEKKVRAGIGKTRGRKYQKKKGPLIVVSDECPLLKAARNIAGIDVVSVKSLNPELLAPGAMPGRITLWTENAVEEMSKNKLYA
jgi:large subunit ribosomal protein L4e